MDGQRHHKSPEDRLRASYEAWRAMTEDDPETEAQRKELADIIYRINPFAVSHMGKEGRAIANLAMAFRESTAPEFMLQNLMDDLRQVARRRSSVGN